MSETARFLRLQIPDNATLQEVIHLINFLGIVVDVNDKVVSRWLYNHKDWVLEKEY